MEIMAQYPVSAMSMPTMKMGHSISLRMPSQVK